MVSVHVLKGIVGHTLSRRGRVPAGKEKSKGQEDGLEYLARGGGCGEGRKLPSLSSSALPALGDLPPHLDMSTHLKVLVGMTSLPCKQGNWELEGT